MSHQDLTAVLSGLEVFPHRLAACFAEFPRSMRHWRPPSWEGIPSERLTAIEQICHLRDIERDGYHVRIRRTLSEHSPVLEDIAGEPLAVEREYFQQNAETVFGDFQAARAQTLALITGLSEDQMQRSAVFEGRPTTLRGLLHFLSSHDNQHLAGMHWLLARMQDKQSA